MDHSHPRRLPERTTSPFSTSPFPHNMSPNPAAIPVNRVTSSVINARPVLRRGSSGSRVINQTLTLGNGAASTAFDTSSGPNSPKRPQPELKPKPCENCDAANVQTWHCSYCDMLFCDPCWVKQGPHKSGKTGPDGLPHEKADLRIVKRLKDILTPSSDPTEQAGLHIDDEDTTWFGIDRDNNHQPVFYDYGRYATIIANSTTPESKVRYPQLVSFIGQTGAGKSTLVKMLIDQQERQSSGYPRGPFPSPVVGSSRNDNVPTSGDVHLYGDPRTYNSQYPVLYADCEGLEGGENTPMSVQFKEKSSKHSNRKRSDSNPDHRKRTKITRVARGTQRHMTWANSPETQKRQYAVTELYPRLLYTFSDVIVFVLRNPKTFESSVLSKLLGWASASMEKSLNQPTLPHAIIALNATDMEVDPREWEPEFATRTLMANVAGAIHRDSGYRQLADYWSSQEGRRINTTKDLLECYYSSVTVVRIPVKGRYMKIDEQINKLHTTITERSAQSFRAKRSSRMLSNSEELNIYLQSAFDHFSNDLDTPFNFMDVAFKINPIPLDFGGNILKLAVAMRNSGKFEDPRQLFKDLSFMVASCILLDCSRQNLKGPADRILERGYLDYCDNALEDYCAIFLPCQYENRRGRCVNVREGHIKGHQNERGAVIGKGAYESTFTWESFEDDWEQHLQNHLLEMQEDLNRDMQERPNLPEITLSSRLHLRNVNHFYRHLGGAKYFVSHSACFCCLREMAEHPLPCGHVLCKACIKAYGDEQQQQVSLAACPLHNRSMIFSTPWRIPIKAELAGVRILSLDGGGIRGIVELEVLRQIEIALGGCIPIQEFFDLIVGTSTGGIIAIALGIENWSIQKCITMFLKLCDKAFQPKLGGLRLGSSKYRTRPLEEVLQNHFKPERIFGGFHEASASYRRKVAITSATETGEHAVIFTNYNRAEDGSVNYRMERPDEPRNELLLWEVARATSAAPTFFRPLVNSRTKEGYLDGAIYHNNPVRIANYESKLLWPDAQDYHPDILLSIGTGHNGQDTGGSIDMTRQESRRYRLRKFAKSHGKAVETKPAAAAWNMQWMNWLNVLFKRVDNILDSEQIWKGFKQDVQASSSYLDFGRYQRFNVRVGFRPPKMDEKNEIGRLHEAVRHKLGLTNYQQRLTRTARRLFAGCFYFQKTAPVRDTEDHFDVQGEICCRFTPGTGYLRHMGHWLRKHQLQFFQPYFRVFEVNNENMAQKLIITGNVIAKMVEQDHFDMGSIVIPVSLQMGVVSIQLHVDSDKHYLYPISGMPRVLTGIEPPKPPSSPTPSAEHSRATTRRKSLRKRRTPPRHQPALSPPATISEEVPPSYDTSEDTAAFPDSPEHVNDWAERRAAAAIPRPNSPRNMQMPDMAELDGTGVFDGRADVLDEEEDEELAKALEQSLVEQGVEYDPDELARALEQSRIFM
ncbi:hypothetical protein EJ05DRAFT_499409 [Pseudovirgaria hyperparasitica]|uniref:FabD/lysophospholipase-like protein n=1 Tax=Pseudovirgaria hyperparasitica TaxID=470096 RepID=A0A6A6W8V6_9PEZI|nr:uncharacterized protein EJ05DRAFT_499409 [Pseudovirgaria hyperparasitica]KAF2758985.1 hypothetical protein EJ05DRAFT_499409 [Pseudovirgaria hyperparasitica]